MGTMIGKICFIYYKHIISGVVKNKEYFVLSTNVDGQFYNSGFDRKKVFEIQGDYSYLQCENACHNKLYNNKEINDLDLAGEKIIF